MNSETIFLDAPITHGRSHCDPAVPPIVRIVLTQAARHRMRGQIMAAKFDDQIKRLTKEELEPRGLSVLVRDLPSGTTRFIIKSRETGRALDLIEIGPDQGGEGVAE